LIFESNIIAGHFVRQFVASLYQKFIFATTRPSAPTDASPSEETVCDYSLLFPVTESGSRTALVDLGVYTKNRNFRIFGSTKLGKNAPLTLHPSCKYPFDGNEEKLFLDSLASVVPDEYSQPIPFTSIPGAMGPEAPHHVHQDHDHGPSVSSTNAVSPYPELDAFVKQVLETRPGHRGFIRGWMLFESSSLLAYQIGGNRYCERIGREHKSNHITIAVDLNRCVWYQRCLDPECRAGHYRSEARPIPPQVICPLLGDDILDLEVDMALREAERNGSLLSDDVLASMDLP
jgi:hypothetical protein